MFDSTVIDRIIKRTDNFLQNYPFSSHENLCYQEINAAVLHPLVAGGKRLRPLLCQLLARCLSDRDSVQDTALCWGASLEMIHTYSLVHDDLPCMDNDSLRRGKPTTHVVFGEAKALLVGDALLTEAFYNMSNTKVSNPHALINAVKTLAFCSGTRGMIGGQWIDITLENNKNNSLSHRCEETLHQLHSLKTGALFQSSFILGYLAAVSFVDGNIWNEKDFQSIRGELEKIGLLLGASFQIQDDILDCESTSEKLGKSVGKDAQQHKLTAISLWGKDKAKKMVITLGEECIARMQEFFHQHNVPSDNLYRNELITLLRWLLKRDF